MNRVNSTLFRSSGTRKMLISVLNIRHLRRRAAPQERGPGLIRCRGLVSSGTGVSPVLAALYCGNPSIHKVTEQDLSPENIVSMGETPMPPGGRAAPEARQLYDSAGAPSAGAGSAWALDFLGVWRGTNFFLGLGNSNGSPLRF